MYVLSLFSLLAYAVAVCVLILILLTLSYYLGPRHRPNAAADAPFESGIVPADEAHPRFPVNFYLTAMFFVIFDLESVYLFAWSIAAREAGQAGLLEALIFVIVLLAALAYLWRTGALEWAPRTARRAGG